MITKMKLENVDELVNIHLKSFPGFFLSFLGSNFLKVYYQGICKDENSIAFVALNLDGLPVGFVVGAKNPQGFYSKLMKRDWAKFAIASIRAICKKPIILVRLIRALTYPKENALGDNIAGLFSIGVLPDAQNLGVGRILIEAFTCEARVRGCKEVVLSTDRDFNEYANQFYLKMGFTVYRQHTTPEGRVMNEYRIEL